jgi:hypothetical protein
MSAPDEYGILSHCVNFVLIAKFGDRMRMGSCIISQHDQAVWDEDGVSFPSVDATIRAHADELLRLTPMPGRRVSHPSGERSHFPETECFQHIPARECPVP